MERILNYQMSFFGLYSNIKPETGLILRLMEKFKDDKFIPGTVNLATIDGFSGKVINENRIRMVTEDNIWEIVFMNNRIDINYKVQEDNIVNINDINVLTNKAKLYARKAFEVLKIKSNRLAINFNALTYTIKEEYYNNFINSFNIIPSFYKDEGLKDFTTSVNKSIGCAIAGSTEQLNVVTTISLANKIINSRIVRNNEKQFLLGMDINTSAENVNERFNENSIGEFSNQALTTLNDIINDFEEIFTNGEFFAR